ncbi:MAG: serine protease [Rhodospirillales bacterium]|nr:serine protease [Rhodospirillales bacterium]
MRLLHGIAITFVVGLCTIAPATAASLTKDQVFELYRAVVAVQADVPADARTANSLGRTRRGGGVVIDGNGLVLTIGYLVLEASSVSLTDFEGREIPASIIAYDHETGFGLLRALSPLAVEPVRLGRSSEVEKNDPVLALGPDGPQPVTPQRVVDRRPFAGYWEYLLENAIFTAPAHPGFGGAPLINRNGEVVGIGSLFVNDAFRGPPPLAGNMFVPIDLLKPIMADLLTSGRRTAPAHPWLGLTTNEAAGRVFVTRVTKGGPADAAGMQAGDIIMGVGGQTVHGMVDFFRRIRARGVAGTEIPMDVLSAGGKSMSAGRVVVRSRDRHDWLKLSTGSN